jgi:hypothetical protein
MQWDLGLQGIALLILLSLGFGAVAQLLFWSRATWWVGLGAATAFFVVGVLISEGLFGWATEAELQPNIDGLSFDEVLLGYFVGIPLLLAGRFLVRRREQHRPVNR